MDHDAVAVHDTEAPVNTGTNDETATDVAAADELLIEEISIDGMCGVY